MSKSRQRIAIAILALGGQGGGVLSDWIVTLATRKRWFAQSTSVPGVAQRTGTTIYYLELFPGLEIEHRPPVLALSPVPGDVDLVIASELMEAGRAMLRGLVSGERTTLIASTHRIYSVSEKSAIGDGRSSGDKVLAAAQSRARRFLGFDMQEAADHAGCIISAVMFGALAQSKALPFSTGDFEAVIQAGPAADSNVRGFHAGLKGVRAIETPSVPIAPVPTTNAGRRLLARVCSELPGPTHYFALEGVRRLMDYQDAAYADLYLDRVRSIAAIDRSAEGWALTSETARHLALWMSYEDTIRVADLKTRGARYTRVKSEVLAKPGQVVTVTEFMHPRLQEFCETLPARWGSAILSSPRLSAWLEPMFRKGRDVTTTNLGWFLTLRVLASLRHWRRKTLRFKIENARIADWLEIVERAGRDNPAAALALIKCQRLVKGYGDTFARGLRNFTRIMVVYNDLRGGADVAAVIDRLREAALRDEEGISLGSEIADLADHKVQQHP